MDDLSVLRPADETLEGYAWLPRMLDKARATQAGLDTGYPFGCPVDHTCMARLGIGPELVLDLVSRHGTDDAAILAELRSSGIPDPESQWFDAAALEEELQSGGPYLRTRRIEQLPIDSGASGHVFAGQEHGAGASVVLIDLAPGASQVPHMHPDEEVLVVQSGRGTVHLGPVQARTVGAREIIRIPSDVVHWVVNGDRAPFTAVAAFGTATITTIAVTTGVAQTK